MITIRNRVTENVHAFLTIITDPDNGREFTHRFACAEDQSTWVSGVCIGLTVVGWTVETKVPGIAWHATKI